MADTSSRPTKKTTTKKSATKKTAAKTAAKRPAAKKAAAKRPARESTRSADAPRSGSAGPNGSEVAVLASQHLLELTGKTSEGVIGLEKTDDGWKVEVEVLELRRVPSTTDILATYEVSVDGNGDLIGYRRLHRYVRGTPGEE